MITTNSKGTTDLLAYNFGSGTTTPQESLLYSIYGCGTTETGELQLSPNGNKLAWYRHDKTISGFKTRTGYIYTLPLAPNKTSLNGTVDVHSISDAGNYGNGALEFMANSNDILYAQRGMYTEGPGSQKYDRNVWKYDPINLSTLAINPDNLLSPVNISYLFGEIKRGSDGRFYIPNMGSPADKIHSYTGSSWTGTVNVSEAAYEFAGALPTQVWKLYADPTQTLSEYPRYVGSKEYELKDHLGNVHVVISDTKLMEDIGSSNNQVDNNDNFIPEVLVYQDYYPFGFGLVGRKYTANGEYRYGFNGKENDAETGTQDYGMRIYDTRLGKFLSVDPLTKDYANLTPYQFASNTPIIGSDLDGGEIQQDIYGNVYYGPVDPKTIKYPIKKGQTAAEQIFQKQIQKPVVAPATPIPDYLTKTFGDAKPIIEKGKKKEAEFRSDNRAQWQKDQDAYNQWLKERQQAEPYMYGGGDFGMGFASTMGTTIKVAPSVVLPGIAADYIFARVFATATTEAAAVTGISGDTYSATKVSSIFNASDDSYITLYRGISGTEGTTGLYLTEEEAYAASYAAEGVVESYKIPKIAFDFMKNEGLMTPKTGINTAKQAGTATSQGQEYLIENETIIKEILTKKIN